MTLKWIATDLATSQVLADLPGVYLDPQTILPRTIGQYDTAPAHLYLDGAPANWRRATLHGGAVLHAYADGDDTQTPQWSGIVLQRVRNTGSDTCDLSLASGEAYLARRYVGDKTYTAEEQCALAADLVTTFAADTNGVPFQLDITTGTTVRDRTYNSTDNATVYQRLQELMAVQGGPEWTVQWRWADDREHIEPWFVVADRLGTSPIAGLAPSAAFTMPGNLTGATLLTEDYTSGKGANRATAYSAGEGSATPVSDTETASDLGGRPVWEIRWSPSSSISDVSTLNAYAQQAVAQLADGANAVTLVAAIGARGVPVFGRDWTLGDDIYYSIGGQDSAGRETVKAFPGGISGTVRAVAHALTDSTTSPIAAADNVTEVQQ